MRFLSRNGLMVLSLLGVASVGRLVATTGSTVEEESDEGSSEMGCAANADYDDDHGEHFHSSASPYDHPGYTLKAVPMVRNTHTGPTMYFKYNSELYKHGSCGVE